MSETFADLSQLSREELYSLVNALKRQINCLSTDLSRNDLLLNKCHKCLTHLLNTKQIDLHLIRELVDLIALNGKQSVVCIKQSNDNQKDFKYISQNLRPIGCRRRSSDQSIVYADNQLIIRDITYETIDETIGGQQSGDESDGNAYQDVKTFDTNTNELIGETSRESNGGRRVDSLLVSLLTSSNTTSLSTEHYFEGMAPDFIRLSTSDTEMGDKSVDNNRRQRVHKKSSATDPKDSDKTSKGTPRKRAKRAPRTGRYGCDHPNCCRRFLDYEALARHKRSGPHRSADGRYLCDYIGCDKSYTQCGPLNDHRISHTGATYRCDRPGCVSQFTTPAYLRKHITGSHGSDYRCDWRGCGFATGDKYRYTQHRAAHSAEREVECTVAGCQRRFTSHQHMTVHQLKAHPDAFPDIPWIECSHTGCQYKSKTNYDMNKHLGGHVKGYRCSECGKGYRVPAELREHMATHDPSLKYRCEWPGCEQLFNCKQTLKRHRNFHTQEFIYRCHWPGCDKTYLDRRSLGRHELSHKGVRRPDATKYRCEWPGCEYATGRAIYLEKHMVKHKR